VAQQLEIMRASAPPAPASLDAAVLADYRRSTAERIAIATTPRWRARLDAAIPWAAALAFAALVAYGAIEFLVPHETFRSVERQPSFSGQRQSVQEAANQAPPKDLRPKATTPKVRHAASSRERKRDLIAQRENLLPQSFKSLVYCDQISCPGAMDVIRVQLPAPVLGLTQLSARTGNTVSADVLVGSDGIARGIRIVQ
jgi:hypothetical protein